VPLALVLAAALSALAAEPQASSPSRSPAPRPTPSAVIEGIVKGPDGKPVENALVVASSLRFVLGDAPLSARTDAQGAFRLQLKRVAPLHLEIHARGLAPWRNEKVLPGAPLVVSLGKGFAIEGVVRDGNNGTPIPGARVAAAVGMSLSWEPESGLVQAVTDAKGRYRLEGLASGSQHLSARAPGYDRVRRQGVRGGATADFHLFPGASLSGRVLGPAGKPVADAVVVAEPEVRMSGPPAERTDAAGRFEMSGVTPGSYTLYARHPDLAPGMTAGVFAEHGFDAVADISLATGATISGRLLGSDDAPVAGSVVVQELNGRRVGSALAEVLRADTGPEGRFKLDRVPPGFHVLGALAPRHLTTRLDFDVGARARAVELGDVRLEAGLSISGRVADRAGHPIGDASIAGRVQGPGASDAPAEARSSPDGRFVLGGLSQARYWLSVGADGYAEANRTVQPGDERVEFILEPSGTITGLVVDESGKPIDSYVVTAEPTDDTRRSLGSSVANVDGRFKVEGLSAGGYVLQVTAPDRAPATRSDVEVAAGGTVDVGLIRVSRGGIVRGTVADSQGIPVPGASVSVQAVGREYSQWILTTAESVSDQGGAFELRGVLDATVVAVARHPEYADGQSEPFEVDSRGMAETRIVLLRGGRIEGSARKRDGSPVVPATVSAGPFGGAHGQGVAVRPDGSFAIERVQPGRVGVFLRQGTGHQYYGGQSRETDVREGETSVVDFVQRDILVWGHVRRSGQPAAGMNVRLRGRYGSYNYIPTPGPTPSGPQRLVAFTRDDGSFELLADEPGSARVMVESADGRLALPSRTVEIPDVESFQLDLDFAGAAVAGLVSDKQTGQPVPDATVYAVAHESPRPGPARSVTGSDGRFHLELEDGRYRLNVSADSYASEGRELSVPASGEILFALTRGVLLRGKVVDAAGRGIHGLDVTAFAGNPGDWSGQAWAQTRPDGSFQFEPMLRRAVNVFTGNALLGFGLAAGVVPGETPLTIPLRAPGQARLFVRGSGGVPAAGARAGVVAVDGARIMSNLPNPPTDSQGIADLVLPAGRVELEVWVDNAEGRAIVDVPEGGSVSAEVTLVPPE
jgi:protocatechuate 3,4-dioxygenase beta subunit